MTTEQFFQENSSTAKELDDLIYEEGCAGLRFKPVPVRAFEIWVFEVRCEIGIDFDSHKTNITQSGRAEWQESVIPDEQGTSRMRSWLDAQEDFKGARHADQDQSRVVGGLRLLVQNWTKQDGILDAEVPIMPFLKANFNQIMERLCLPRSFPMDFARCQQIPAEVKHISNRYGDRVEDRLGWLPEHHLCSAH